MDLYGYILEMEIRQILSLDKYPHLAATPKSIEQRSQSLASHSEKNNPPPTTPINWKSVNIFARLEATNRMSNHTKLATCESTTCSWHAWWAGLPGLAPLNSGPCLSISSKLFVLVPWKLYFTSIPLLQPVHLYRFSTTSLKCHHVRFLGGFQTRTNWQ